jgi:hypothetical protein
LNELKSYSFLQQHTSPHVDGLTCFDAIDNNHDISDDDKVNHVAHSLHYEIVDNSFDTTFSTPAKGEHNDMSRLHQKSHLRISPNTKSLHGTIAENSQSKILMHSEESIQVTRANILKNLDWMISNGDIFNNQNIDRNCNVLPLLKFCTNKPILALLLRQFFLGGGKGGVSPKERV